MITNPQYERQTISDFEETVNGEQWAPFGAAWGRGQRAEASARQAPHRQKNVSRRARRGAEYLTKIPERGVFVNVSSCLRRTIIWNSIISRLRISKIVLKNLITRFNEQNMDLVMCGGLTLSTMGIHRLTKDIDIVVDEISKNTAHKIMTELGYEKQDFSSDWTQDSGDFE